MAGKITTPIGILSFPALFEPRAAFEGGEPRYSLNIVFDADAQKTDEYKAMVKAVDECAHEFFKGKPPKNWRSPIRDASEKEYNGYGEGKTYISAWTKNRPGVIDRQQNEIDVPDDVFAGQKVRATIRPFGYDQTGNKGVSFGLLNVQVTKKDMPRLDGRMDAKDEFGTIDDEDGDDTPF